MNDIEYERIIKRAVAGDMGAIYEIIKKFEKLIDSKCFIKGCFDEDCKSFIITTIIKDIHKFKKV